MYIVHCTVYVHYTHVNSTLYCVCTCSHVHSTLYCLRTLYTCRLQWLMSNRLSSTIGGNREMNHLYSTSQVYNKENEIVSH